MRESQQPVRDRVLHAEYERLSCDYDRRWEPYVASAQRPMLECLRVLATQPDAAQGGMPDAGLCVADFLDVGCGTGTLLQGLAKFCSASRASPTSSANPEKRLVGVDASAAMLEVARRKLGSEALLCEAHAAALPFAAESFGCVISSSAFHYLREPRLALRESFRVLKPGGVLLLADWCADFWSTRIATQALRILRRPLHHVYRSQELCELCEQVGFRHIEVMRYRAAWPWGMLQIRAQRPEA